MLWDTWLLFVVTRGAPEWVFQIPAGTGFAGIGHWNPAGTGIMLNFSFKLLTFHPYAGYAINNINKGEMRILIYNYNHPRNAMP